MFEKLHTFLVLYNLEKKNTQYNSYNTWVLYSTLYFIVVSYFKCLMIFNLDNKMNASLIHDDAIPQINVCKKKKNFFKWIEEKNCKLQNRKHTLQLFIWL